LTDNEANPWLTLDVARRFSDDFIIVEEHTVRDAAGKRSIYGVVRYRHRGLLVLPVDNDGSPRVRIAGNSRPAASSRARSRSRLPGANCERKPVSRRKTGYIW
jgi:hypothetical protein